MYVKPSKGLKVRDPQLLDFLPDEGREVPETTYWHRRLRDGDVVSVTPPKKGSATAKAGSADK